MKTSFAISSTQSGAVWLGSCRSEKGTHAASSVLAWEKAKVFAARCCVQRATWKSFCCRRGYTSSSWAPLSYKKIPPENVDRISAININWNFIQLRFFGTQGVSRAKHNLWHISAMNVAGTKVFLISKKKIVLCCCVAVGSSSSTSETTKMRSKKRTHSVCRCMQVYEAHKRNQRGALRLEKTTCKSIKINK